MFRLLGINDYKKKSMLILDTINLLFVLIVAIIDIYISSDISEIVLLLFVVASMILFVFSSKFEDINDELTENIMSKVNGVCIEWMIPVITIIGIFTIQKNILFSRSVIGIMIIASMFILSVLRVILYIHYERKGIY